MTAAAPVRGNMVERLTRAAYAIIAEDGVVRLTLDAVASKAGVSKGALQHHFRSKMELARHMLRESMAEFELSAEAHRAGDTSSGAWTRAYLNATLDPRYAGDGKRIALLLVPVARAPELHEILKETRDRWLERIANDGLDPTVAQIVQLAADGCWWSETAETPVFKDGESRQRFVAALIEMTKQP